MFGKKGKKTLFDYIEAHEPYHPIEDLQVVNYLEGTVSVEHKELEQDVSEYWDLIHPLVKDFINSYAKTYQSLSGEVANSREEIESHRRNLTFEQQNVQDLSDKVREIKGQLQNEMVIRRDLDERLKDERTMMENQFNEEKKAMEIMIEAKFPEGDVDVAGIVKQVSSNVSSSEEVKRLNDRLAEFEAKIASEREENERIQGELSMSFMEKITKYDAMIQNLKARLGEE